jgi:hypothetical protein
MQRSSRIPKAVCRIVIAIFSLSTARADCFCKDPASRIGIYVTVTGGQSIDPALLAMLNTQVWASLRPSRPDQPNLKFGCGMVETYSHGAPKCSQLVLANSVSRIGRDAILQATLSRRGQNDLRKTKREIWTVEMLGKTVQFDPVDEYYSLPPVVIPEKSYLYYSNQASLKICEKPEIDSN